MMRKGVFILGLLLAMLAPAGLRAQITASPANGCAPLSGVQFTGPSGATNISWDFGNGTSSNLASPSATYNTPGLYTVTYTATVNNAPVNFTTQVRVYASPTAAFRATTDTVGCTLFPVSFQDQSTSSGGATISQWEWAFGDGSTSTTGPNNSHNYTLAGRFSVTLKVTDSNGCVATATRTNQITTSKTPNVVVTSAPASLNSCTAPFTVTFSAATSTSNSPTGSGLTYAWNFGNGTTSTLANPPAVTYTATGTYTVSLTVTDNLGCDTTVTRTVLVDRPVASFFAQGAVNDSVCQFVRFVNQTLGASVSWQYGDGFAGTADTHTYQIPGTYQVTMFAFAGGCADDTTITIHVTKPVADFQVTPLFSCDTFIDLQFTSLSTGATTNSWSVESFIGNFSSTSNNFTRRFTLRDTTDYVLYDDTIVFKVKLTARNSAGCIDTLTKSFAVLYPPTARFMADTFEGCAPLTVEFADSSRSIPPTITNYTWIFGDGTVITGTNANPTHTYNTPGVYEAKLVIVNANGCRDTSIVRKIYVRSAPNANFSFGPTVLCLGDTLRFANLTPAVDSADTWNYLVDNIPLQNHCPNDPNGTWVVNLPAGTYPLSLEAGRNQCYGTKTFANAIQVKGPSGRFEMETDCANRNLVSLNAITNNVDSLVWNFGDGTIINTTTNTNPTHTYVQAGNYPITLTMYNRVDGCAPQTYIDTAKIRNLSVTLPPDYKVCVGDTFNFRATAPVDVFATCSRGYLWDFGPTSPLLNTSVPRVDFAYSQSGTNPLALYVRDENDCWDTVRTTVRVYGIEAAFAVSDTVGCLPLPVTFTDNSVSDTTINRWFWWFGDLGTSTAQNPSHTYNNPPFGSTSYNAFLVVRNLFGCFDTAFATITPSIPVATFNAVGTRFLCAGDSLRLLASVNTHDAYTWNFGDGSAPGPDSFDVVHYYNTPGTYNVSLTVVDTVGCTGSQSINQFVIVQGYPTAGFISSGDSLATLCYPIQLSFTDTSQNGTLTRYWDLGTGSPVQPTQTVGTLFDSSGTYNVQLVVQSSFGCRDTVVRTFNVEGPEGDFTLSKNAICKGEDITFAIVDTSDVQYFSWNFGDGTGDDQVSPITHTYNFHPPSGQTVVSLVMWSTDSACATSVQKPIIIHRVIADFARNGELALADTAHCLGVVDVFDNNSIGADQWSWDFGNGTNYVGENPPQVSYTNAGVYTISLAVRDQTLGCVDTLSKTLEVFPLPELTTLGGFVCEGTSVELEANVTGTQAPVVYVWSPSASLSDSSVANPAASPTVTTTYQLIVTDTNTCADTALARVDVLQRPPSIDWDTLIVIGQQVILNVGLGSGYTYTWTPTEGLSCGNCPVVTAQPLVDTDYTVTIKDTAGCFEVPSYYRFEVKPETTIDVPTAFTPNGDGSNDLIFVRGWGIKSLLEFKIYNRWGQLVFETNDINQGWDGTFNGKPQNNDTYTYHAVVETWLEINGKARVLEKTGSFNLLR